MIDPARKIFGASGLMEVVFYPSQYLGGGTGISAIDKFIGAFSFGDGVAAMIPQILESAGNSSLSLAVQEWKAAIDSRAPIVLPNGNLLTEADAAAISAAIDTASNAPGAEPQIGPDALSDVLSMAPNLVPPGRGVGSVSDYGGIGSDDWYTMPLFHGTTLKFDSLDVSMASVDAHWGLGTYLSTSRVDATLNYANISGDLKAKIGIRAEEIEREQGLSYEESVIRAERELVGGPGRVIEAKAHIENPAIFGVDANGVEHRLPPYKMYNEEDLDDFLGQAIESVKADYGITNEELESYQVEIREAQESLADENGYYNEEEPPLLVAVKKVAYEVYDESSDEIANPSIDLYEEPTLAEVEDWLRNEVFQYATSDMGPL